MDPFAHTLVGAALAQTGLGKRTTYGTAALVIGANLPDIDGLSYFWGGDMGFYIRRGWTHGLPAMAVLPLVLTGLLLLFGRWRRRSGPRAHSPPRAGALLALSYLALITHPSLDWLNTYGMRWLMPLDGTWFYGDSLFIVDPWMWLVLGGCVFLGYSRSTGSRLAWATAGGLATLLLMQASPPGLWLGKVIWLAGLAGFVFLKLRGLPSTAPGSRYLAVAALGLIVIYIGAQLGTTVYARKLVAHELEVKGVRVERLMVGPVPVSPLSRDVVVETSDRYYYGSLELFPQPSLTLEDRTLPKLNESPITNAALRSPKIRGFVSWVRFPSVEVEETEDGYLVTIMDLRYTRRPGTGFGVARVPVTMAQIATQ